MFVTFLSFILLDFFDTVLMHFDTVLTTCKHDFHLSKYQHLYIC